MKKRNLKLIKQKLIGVGIMASAVPVFHILNGELMWPLLLIGLGFWVLVQKKLLSEIAMDMAKKENEEDLK